MEKIQATASEIQANLPDLDSASSFVDSMNPEIKIHLLRDLEEVDKYIYIHTNIYMNIYTYIHIYIYIYICRQKLLEHLHMSAQQFLEHQLHLTQKRWRPLIFKRNQDMSYRIKAKGKKSWMYFKTRAIIIVSFSTLLG
jgi:hypothetical protein